MDSYQNLGLKQISHNTIAQIAIRAIATSASVFSIFIITYFQGFDLLGEFTKVTAFVTFFYLFADFGLNAMFIKYYFESTSENIGNLIHLRLYVSLIVGGIVILIASILPYDPIQQTGYSLSEKIGVVLFSLTIITQATLLSLNSLLQRSLKFHLAILPSILSACTMLTLVFLGAKTGSLYVILSGIVIAQIIYITWLYKKTQATYHITLHTHELKTFSIHLLKVSAPLGCILVLNTIMTKSDLVILSVLSSNFDVGIYSFAYKIFDVVLIIPTFITISIYPILLQKEMNKSIGSSVVKYTVILFIMSIIIALSVFFSSPLLKLVRGDFSLSVAPLQILTLSLPFFFLTSIFQWVLIVKERLTFLISLYALVMIVSIMLNIIFIPAYSYFATSVVTVVTEGLVFLLMILYFGIEKTKIFQKRT